MPSARYEERVVPFTAGDGLECRQCKLLYPIKDDIPIMLIDEARRLE